MAEHYPTYQYARTLLMIVDGGQMECGASVFAALLDVDDVAKAAHDLERVDAIQFGGHVNRGQFLFVENAGIHRSVDCGCIEKNNTKYETKTKNNSQPYIRLVTKYI